ncbi:MAG: IS110 family transposase [Microbacterium sp. SCN 70-18]|nr:MAG: IS110 family transposase [Microbacterium sp. SCN 70-18]
MMILGVDPHKSTHTATAVDPSTNRAVASIRIAATLADYRQLMKWARQFENRRWAIENAEGLGRHLSAWLLARGEQVVDVPSTATARIRQLSRGGGRKTDQIDAAAAASVAALQGDERPLHPEGVPDALALLDESRTNLTQSRVRLVNQLHALLRDLIAGGAPTDLTAATAAALLRGVRPIGAAEKVRKQIASGLVGQIRAVDALLKANQQQIKELVSASGSTLTDTVGIAAITAGRLIGRTGMASRFPTAAAFANYAGTAPIEVASAERSRHRLSRGGDRQLNAALHTVAITQIRTAGSRGHAYYAAKLAEGKTPRDARRCLKRRLADHVWRTMLADEQRAGLTGHSGATTEPCATSSTPTTGSLGKSQPDPLVTSLRPLT